MKWLTGRNIITIKSLLRLFNLLILAGIIHINISGQNLPLGYVNYFSHNCDNEKLFEFLLPEIQAEWTIVKDESKNTLQIKPSGDSLNSIVPISRGILDNLMLGDYILEFEMKTVITENVDTAGFCFIGPARSREIYYSFIFSKDTVYFFSTQYDSIMCLNSLSLNFKHGLWNKVRIERNILTRSFIIMINDEQDDRITFSDRNLVMGYIGFGSHRATSFLKNIRLYAPTAFQENPFHW